MEIKPVMKQKNGEITYICKYHNVWKNGRSYSTNKKVVGRLFDKGVVKFGRTFLKENPEFNGKEGRFTTGCVEVVDQPGAAVPEQDVVHNAIKQKSLDVFLGMGVHVLDQIADQSYIKNDILKVFGTEKGQKILSLAYYFCLDESAVAEAYEAAAQITKYPAGPLPSQRITELFRSITPEEVMCYQMLRIERNRSCDGNLYWAYDTTSISTFSQANALAAFGKNKENDPLQQINLGLILDEQTYEPVFYHVLEGSMNDAKAFRDLLSQLTFIEPKRIRLVLDRAFSAPKQISEMFWLDSGFLAGSKSSYHYCKKFLGLAKSSLPCCDYKDHIRNTNIWAKQYEISWHFENPSTHIQDKAPLYIHLYYSPSKRLDEINIATQIRETYEDYGSAQKLSDEQRRILSKIMSRTERRNWVENEEKWREYQSDAGYFFLVSNCVKDPAAALSLYRNRGMIEEGFNSIKERIDGRRLRCHEKTISGKFFVLIVALSLRMILMKKFNDLDPKINKFKCLEDFLIKIRTVKLFQFTKNDETYSYWSQLPFSVENVLKGLEIKTPH